MEGRTLYQITADDLAGLIRQAVTEAVQGIVVQPTQEPEPRYMTGTEVDKLFHITPMTRISWADKGLLKRYKIGRRVLYRADEVEAALAEVVPLKYRRVKHV